MDDTGLPSSALSWPKGGMPFAGVATFAGYPLWKVGQKADAVFLGVPYDEGTTYRPGARFGPRGVRDASMLYRYEDQKDRFYDSDRRRWILSGKTVADAGDVEIEPLSLRENWNTITRAVKAILLTGALPAVVGGDHSITHPVIEAFEGRRFHYVHFDAHVDCDISGKNNHGGVVVRVLESGLAQSVILVGVRGLTNSGHEFSWIERRASAVITARELRARLRRGSLLHQFPPGDYYISLDIDFFDPSTAPGTGTPEPGGLFFPEFSDALYQIAKTGNIIGFDLVEVNPLLDGPGAVTQHLAARCVIELMSAALDAHPDHGLSS